MLKRLVLLTMACASAVPAQANPARPGTPSAVVEAFLTRHFAGDMGFDSASVAGKSAWLAPSLRAAIAKYFRKPPSPDEAPAIDGDPFTDSQEYPTRFAVAAAKTTGATATVSVRFSDARRSRSSTYLLQMLGGQWKIVDVRWSDGQSFARLLK